MLAVTKHLVAGLKSSGTNFGHPVGESGDGRIMSAILAAVCDRNGEKLVSVDESETAMTVIRVVHVCINNFVQSEAEANQAASDTCAVGEVLVSGLDRRHSCANRAVEELIIRDRLVRGAGYSPHVHV